MNLYRVTVAGFGTAVLLAQDEDEAKRKILESLEPVKDKVINCTITSIKVEEFDVGEVVWEFNY